MPRRVILIGTLAVLVAVGVFIWRNPEETQSPDTRKEASTVEKPARPVAQQEAVGETERASEATTDALPGGARCSPEDVEKSGGIKIGDFAPPEEDVPQYKILQEEPVERGGAKTTRLLVDTRARSEADYTLIARDIKSSYKDLDAVTIEFTDTKGAFSYNGGALIFNTPCGSDYMGYFRGPPNNEGYYVSAAKD